MTSDRSTVDVDAALAVVGLRKSFGALVATDDVSLDVRNGEIHALIGPNGAGKSTLIAQISGETKPNSGTIRMSGRDVTGLKAYARARVGLGRSFQHTQLCLEFSAIENVMLAIETSDGGSFDMFRDPRNNGVLRNEARHWLSEVGVAALADRSVEFLGHGERRQLEIAVALARRPSVLLLDEPMAGMGPEESKAMTRLLSGLKGAYAILLIEHDMDAVFALADRVSVLVSGKVIFTGSVDEVRGHPDVQAAYLGGSAC